MAIPPNMTDDQLKAFGQMIIEWTLNPESQPGTADELKSKLDALGIPHDDFHGIEIHTRKAGVFTVLLPEADMVRDGRDRYCGPDPQPYIDMPRFYERLAFHRAPDVAPEHRCDFYTLRVGDYTTSRCG